MFVCTSCGDELEAQTSDSCADCGATVVPVGDDCPIGPGRVLGGRYILLEVLGQGAMGVVFLAKQRTLDKKVAIKVLSLGLAGDKALERFNREAHNAAQLAHPNNVKVFDYGHEDEHIAYIVMEVVPGRPLSKLSFPVPIDRALAIAVQICKALNEAHELGLVHRDLKPDNVMLTELDGEEFARVLDYGIAKTMNQGTVLTQTGMMIGTPRYLSPEQAKGDTVDARSDIYSFGAMLFELVTGQAPFEAPNAIALAIAHIGHTPPDPSTLAPVPRPVEDLILECLAKDPADRPQSFPDVLDRIRRINAGETTGPRRPATSAPLPPTPPRPTPHTAPTHWPRTPRLSSSAKALRFIYASIGLGVAVLVVLLALPGPSDESSAESAADGESGTTWQQQLLNGISAPPPSQRGVDADPEQEEEPTTSDPRQAFLPEGALPDDDESRADGEDRAEDDGDGGSSRSGSPRVFRRIRNIFR